MLRHNNNVYNWVQNVFATEPMNRLLKYRIAYYGLILFMSTAFHLQTHYVYRI